MSTGESRAKTATTGTSTSKRKALVRARRSLAEACDYADPCVALVRKLAAVTGETAANEFPSLVAHARWLVARGGA